MPMGDSITLGAQSSDGTGYRGKLRTLRPELTLVGETCDLAGCHNGVSGWSIEQTAARARAWVSVKRPRVVLLHTGTNNDGRGETGAQMLQRLGLLLDEIYAGSPGTLVLVAQIPRTPFNTAWQQDQEDVYDAGMPGLATSRNAVGQHMRVVDMRATVIGADHIHPGDDGYTFMAQAWSAALSTVST
jgi:lysophospholipase L1-like esterase